MKWSNGYRMRVVVVGIMAVIVFGIEPARADFTFGEPTNTGPTISGSSHDIGPSISVDGLSLFFNSTRPGGLGDLDLWMATREAIGEPWGEPVNLGSNINSPNTELGPAISPNGLELYFSRGWDDPYIFVSKRSSKDAPWGPAVRLDSSINSYNAHAPEFSSDGLSLYFCSNRPGGLGGTDIWVTTRAMIGDSWSEPINLGPNVNSFYNDYGPSISLDDRVLFFDSYRAGTQKDQLWLTVRSNEDDGWESPMILGPQINLSNQEGDAEISPDGSTLYFSFYTGSADIYQAKVLPIVDFNGDGIVDAGDMCTIVDHWGGNDSLCDIGPTPFGDGIVDVQDLIALSKHLFEEVNDPTLIAHWPLDEVQGDIAYNSVANCDGTLMGGPVWQPDGGIVDGALQLDGVDDYVSTDPVLYQVNGKFSVVAWIKGGAPGQAVLSQVDKANWLCTDPLEGTLMTELTVGGRNSCSLGSEAMITGGDWHRIGFVWDGSYRRLYVDGVVVAEDTQDGLDVSVNGLYIGTGKNMESGSFFSGLIDDIRIYNRIVTP